MLPSRQSSKFNTYFHQILGVSVHRPIFGAATSHFAHVTALLPCLSTIRNTAFRTLLLFLQVFSFFFVLFSSFCPSVPKSSFTLLHFCPPHSSRLGCSVPKVLQAHTGIVKVSHSDYYGSP